jgi:hypothetical protein
MRHSARKPAGTLTTPDFLRHQGRQRGGRAGELCGLTLFAAANLAVYLFSARYMDGWQQYVVELPLHLLVILTARHILFESQMS